MSDPNKTLPPAASEQKQDDLTRIMEKQPSSDSIQWITEPPAEEQPATERPSKDVTPTTESAKPALTIVEPRHSEEPGPSNSKATDELEKKVRAVELVDDDEDEYKRNPPQTEKDENGFVFYKCRFCGLTFNFMTTLKAHERVHNIEAPYLCPKCNESFHFMCELEFHAKTHEKQKGYKCDCGRTFFQYTDLLYHYHPGEDPEPAPPLPQPEPYVRRFSKLPIDPAEFPTPAFAEQGFEPRHPMRVYSEVRSKPYICQYCSKSYSDSRQLAYHMYGHRGERIFNPRASRYLMARNEYSYISPGCDPKVPFV